jgi:hypothetical protein
METQLKIDIPIERHEGDNYAEAMAEFIKKKGGERTFLCYDLKLKQYYVNWLFTKEFLELHKVKIIQ